MGRVCSGTVLVVLHALRDLCALTSDGLFADPRWLDGAGSDLRACMHDDRDDVAATVQEVLAGELPRQVRAEPRLPSRSAVTLTPGT